MTEDELEEAIIQLALNFPNRSKAMEAIAIAIAKLLYDFPGTKTEAHDYFSGVLAEAMLSIPSTH